MMHTHNILLSLLSIFSIIMVSGCGEHAHDKTVKTYTIAPKSTQNISFKADKPTRITYATELSSEDKQKCKNQCLRMYYVDKKGKGEAVTSATTANLDVPPENGKVSVILKNLEMFPIKVTVTWRG